MTKGFLNLKLYALYIYDCVSIKNNKIIIKIADDTTISGPIKGRDESSYREEINKVIV